MALHSLFAAILFGGAEKVELPSNIFDKEFLQTLTCGEWKGKENNHIGSSFNCHGPAPKIIMRIGIVKKMYSKIS